jgi:hypothetical protein
VGNDLVEELEIDLVQSLSLENNIELYQKIVDHFKLVDCIEVLEAFPDIYAPLDEKAYEKS